MFYSFRHFSSTLPHSSFWLHGNFNPLTLLLFYYPSIILCLPSLWAHLILHSLIMTPFETLLTCLPFSLSILLVWQVVNWLNSNICQASTPAPEFLNFLTAPRGSWNLSSATRIKPLSPDTEAQTLNYWTARESSPFTTEEVASLIREVWSMDLACPGRPLLVWIPVSASLSSPHWIKHKGISHYLSSLK